MATASAEFKTLDDYLTTFAPEMADRVENTLSPLFDPERDQISEGTRLCAQSGMVPYPPQAGVIEAGIRQLKRNSSLWVVGEMGTGKTPIGAWLVLAWEAHLGRSTRNVVSAPNHLVGKWRTHFETIIPGCRCVIVRTYKDLIHLREESVLEPHEIRHANGSTSVQYRRRWKRPATTEVYIIPRDRGKLGYAWRAAPIYGPTMTTDPYGNVSVGRRYSCPDCGARLYDSNGEPLELKAWVTPKGRPTAKRSCRACGSQLWQAFNGDRGDLSQAIPVPGVAPRRVAPCHFLRKIGARFDLYLADEVHENKGGGTLQGQLYGDLASIAEKVIPLTGTLVGGYADNLFHLFWRTCGHRLIRDQQSHDGDGLSTFTKTYGVLQERKRYVAETDYQTRKDLVLGRGKTSSLYVKSLPGISPALFVNYLLDQAVFIRLAEMHAHLPPFDERIHRVELDPAVDAALHQMQADFEDHRGSHSHTRAWAAARAVFLRYPDKPWVDEYEVMDSNEDGLIFPAFTVPTLPKSIGAKELKVIELVKRNAARGRKSWVFTELSGDGEPAWDVEDWYAECLRKAGFRVAVMRATSQKGPKPEDRDAWIAKTAPNVDVVISHPTLVQTGLDLFEFPSLIVAFPGDNTYRLRQVSRRAWRLGQTQPCEVDYIVSVGSESKSMQDAALALMADKMAASLAIEGDFSSEGLAAMAGGEDMGSQLARFIDGHLSIDSESSFAKYRARFEALMPELGTAIPGAHPHPAPQPPLIPAPVPPQALPAPAPGPAAKPSAPRAPRKATKPAPASQGPQSPQATEPAKLADRKAARRSALLAAIDRVEALREMVGLEATDQVVVTDRAGERVLVGEAWLHVVSKRRATVRARNFEAFAASCPDGIIAFVEPTDEAGPTDDATKVSVGGVEYVVSFMAVSDYMNGERTPGLVAMVR